MGFIGNDGSDLAGGLNPSSVVKGLHVDANGNLLVSINASGYTEVTGLSAGSLNADLLAATDVSAYYGGTLSLQVTGVWSGQLQAWVSNDNVNFVQIQFSNAQEALRAPSPSNFIAANGIFVIPIYARWLRVRMTSYVSGTANGLAEFSVIAHSRVLSWVTVANSVSIYASAQTSGGSSDFHLVSAASNNATNIKNSGGQVYGYDIYNANAAVRFVKLYNESTTPNPATDTPFRTIGVPPGAHETLQSSVGLSMPNGIGIAIVTGIADNNNGAVGAGDVVVDLDWI